METRHFFRKESYKTKHKKLYFYRKDTETLYHAFMHSLISLLSSIYPFLTMQCYNYMYVCIDRVQLKYVRDINKCNCKQ